MKELSEIAEAEIEHLRRENRELKMWLASSLIRAGRFHSDLIYAITGTREQISDEQMISTAEALRLMARKWTQHMNKTSIHGRRQRLRHH